MVVSSFFIHVIRLARIEDEIHPLLDQIINVAMEEFGRIASCIARNRFLAIAIQSAIGIRGYDRFKT